MKTYLFILTYFCISAKLISSQGFYADDPNLKKCVMKNESDTCVFNEVQILNADFDWEAADDPDVCHHMHHIKFINSYVRIITNNFCKKCNTIKRFYVADQNVEKIADDAFQDCRYLEHVYLQNNRIKTIPSHIFNSEILSVVQLEYNHITEVNVDLNDDLKELYLGFNDITEFKIRDIPSGLKILTLNSNDLSELDVERIIQDKKFFKQLEFDDNELSCERVEEIVRILTERQIKFQAFNYKQRYYEKRILSNGISCVGGLEYEGSIFAKDPELFKMIPGITDLLNEILIEAKRVKETIEIGNENMKRQGPVPMCPSY